MTSVSSPNQYWATLDEWFLQWICGPMMMNLLNLLSFNCCLYRWGLLTPMVRTTVSPMNIPIATYRNNMRGNPLRQREAALRLVSDSNTKLGEPNGGISQEGVSLELTRWYRTSGLMFIGSKELKRENIGHIVFLILVDCSKNQLQWCRSYFTRMLMI